MGKMFVFGCLVVSAECMTLHCSDGKMALAAEKEPVKMSVSFEDVGGVMVGAKCYAADFSPARFFDKDTTTMWHSAPNNFGWVSISYKKPFKASSYKISRRADISSQAPVDFILDGAVTEKFPDDESKWKILGAQKNQKWTDVLTQTYKIKQPDSFMHYRIRILATEDNCYSSIAEWELVK